MFSLQGKDASKLAGNWFHLSMVVFKKEYLPTSVHFFLVIQKYTQKKLNTNTHSNSLHLTLHK